MSASLDFKRTFQYSQALYSVVRFSLKLFYYCIDSVSGKISSWSQYDKDGIRERFDNFYEFFKDNLQNAMDNF